MKSNVFANHERKIVWEKWVNPAKHILDMIDDEDDEGEEWNEGNVKTLKGPVAIGPLGMIPINKHSDPDRLFDFYIAHTNFIISPYVKNIIKRTAGVAEYTSLTPYMFRVGFAKLANSDFVKHEIEKKLITEQNQPELEGFYQSISNYNSNVVDILKHSMHNKYWIVYFLRNGEHRTIVSEELNEDLKKAKAELTSIQKYIGGRLYSNFD